MSATFDPGPGWRESDGIPDGVEGIMLFPAEKQREPRRTWVREEPLPTEPWTVIRVPTQGAGNDRLLLLIESGQWVDIELGQAIDHRHITGFEVLAEPCGLHYGREDITRAEERVRRETVQAVLDRVDALLGQHPLTSMDLDRVGDEFGEPR